MTDQTVNLAAQIFPYVFPNCQALFVFDNAVNHACFTKNALLARRMNLKVGGKQSWIKYGFNNAMQETQPMIFPENYHNVLLRGKPQELK